jgi:hypothetical protein
MLTRRGAASAAVAEISARREAEAAIGGVGTLAGHGSEGSGEDGGAEEAADARHAPGGQNGQPVALQGPHHHQRQDDSELVFHPGVAWQSGKEEMGQPAQDQRGCDQGERQAKQEQQQCGDQQQQEQQGQATATAAVPTEQVTDGSLSQFI